MGGLSLEEAGPAHVWQIYRGAVPVSLESGWLDSQKDLKPLVIRAYRYAVKALYDCFCLGSMETLSGESAENMTDFQVSSGTYRDIWGLIGCYGDTILL